MKKKVNKKEEVHHAHCVRIIEALCDIGLHLLEEQCVCCEVVGHHTCCSVLLHCIVAH